MRAQRLQCRRRAIGAHHPVRLCDDRRRAGRGAAGARRAGRARARRRAKCSTGSIRCRSCSRMSASRAASRSTTAAVKAVIAAGRGRAERQRPPRHPPLGHRAGDPRDGRGRRSPAGASRGRPHLRRGGAGGRVTLGRPIAPISPAVRPVKTGRSNRDSVPRGSPAAIRPVVARRRRERRALRPAPPHRHVRHKRIARCRRSNSSRLR